MSLSNTFSIHRHNKDADNISQNSEKSNKSIETLITKQWNLYIPDISSTVEIEDDVEDSIKCVIIELIKYFQSINPNTNEMHCHTMFNPVEIATSSSVYLDYDTMIKYSPIDDIADALFRTPEKVLSCLSISIHAFLIINEYTVTNSRIFVHVNKTKPIIPLIDVKANYENKFIAIKGIVTRVSQITPLVQSLEFHCPTCGIDQLINLPSNEYESPQKCSNKSCRNRNFIPLVNSINAIDWQLFRLQETQSSDDIDQAHIPRTIDCEVIGDLVDQCSSGDIVIVGGIIKARSSQRGYIGQFHKKSSQFILYMKVNYLVRVSNSCINDTSHGVVPTIQNTNRLYSLPSLFPGLPGVKNIHYNGSDIVSASGQQISFNELENIYAIFHIPDITKYLVNSLAPSIFGQEIVKFSIQLTLFSGCTKYPYPGTNLSTRGEIHLLLLGDPGLGKSHLLRYAAKIKPRSTYVSGTAATSVGLTAMVHRGEGNGLNYVVEPGAIALSDKSSCFLDELDKMDTSYDCLLECMEQQTISIAKSGIVCQLPARTSIVAAANPKNGTYDLSRSIIDNVKLPLPLLSRFDLILLMLDRPGTHHDSLISKHIISSHGIDAQEKGEEVYLTKDLVQKVYSSVDTRRSLQDDLLSCMNEYICENSKEFQDPIDEDGISNIKNKLVDLRTTLCEVERKYNCKDEVSYSSLSTNSQQERLMIHTPNDPIVNQPSLPIALFSKYIAYINEYVHPVLTEDAKQVLQNFYVDLRERSYITRTQMGNDKAALPVTTRTLYALIRFTEARAKMDGRAIATVSDALDITDLMSTSLLCMSGDTTQTLFTMDDVNIQKQISQQKQQKQNQKKRSKSVVLNLFKESQQIFAQRTESNIVEYDKLLELGTHLQLTREEVLRCIDMLNSQGYLLKRGANTYRISI